MSQLSSERSNALIPVAMLICTAPLLADEGDVAITAQCVVRFSDVEAGQQLLRSEDLFLNSLSLLEIQIRLRSDEGKSAAEFAEHSASQVRAWTDKQREQVSAAWQALGERMKDLSLPLPEVVSLIHTTGKDEGGAAYTRANAIILPPTMLRLRGDRLQRLLAHELFHVLSRHDEATRRELYAIIGFTPCQPVELPEELADRSITNPDAPARDYCIEIEHEGKKYAALPLLLADTANYAELRGQSLFKAMRFRLLLGKLEDDNWQPVRVADELLLLDGRKCKSYREQIGRNTNYIIHPDEVLADNFAHLVMGTRDLPSPEIIEAMKKVLTAADPEETEQPTP